MIAAAGTIQSAQTEYQAARRKAERDIPFRAIVDPARRIRLESSDVDWLGTYLPGVFFNPFTRDQLNSIRECGEALKYGTRKCRAEPRGNGKSSILRYLTLKYALSRQIKFSLGLHAGHDKALKSMRALKQHLMAPGTPLSEDYPFECDICRHVGKSPARANNATYEGIPILTEWSSHMMIMPVLQEIEGPATELREALHMPPKFEAYGPILMEVSCFADEVQGCNVHDIRPDFVRLDDLDSRSSLAAEDGLIATKIEEVIDKTVAGLGGPGSKLGQVMLCTITSRHAAAAKYSDPRVKPSYSGVRIARIKNWPDRMDLWERYVDLRQIGQGDVVDGSSRDPHGREAHDHYLENRVDMDAGAIVSNDHDFDSAKLPDGSCKHVSALQKCFDYIADNGRESFETEHQNNPPDAEDDEFQTHLTKHRITHQCTGPLNRNEVDEQTSLVVAGVDIRKIELHWCGLAATEEASGGLFTYDIQAHGTTETTVQQAEEAISSSLSRFAEKIQDDRPIDSMGRRHDFDLVVVDKGWMGSWKAADGEIKTWATQPVEEFCMSAGLDRFMPCHGLRPYKSPKQTVAVVIGDRWHINKYRGANRRCSEIQFDQAHWAQKVEERFMLEREHAKAFELFKTDEKTRSHEAFAGHIYRGLEDFYNQVAGGRRARKSTKDRRDHWFDSLLMALVAESVALHMRKRGRSLVTARRSLRELSST